MAGGRTSSTLAHRVTKMQVVVLIQLLSSAQQHSCVIFHTEIFVIHGPHDKFGKLRLPVVEGHTTIVGERMRGMYIMLSLAHSSVYIPLYGIQWSYFPPAWLPMGSYTSSCVTSFGPNLCAIWNIWDCIRYATAPHRRSSS
jgi:hypothetical protein